MKKINVGIIGLGVGFKHLKNLEKINKVNKIYFFDFNLKKLKNQIIWGVLIRLKH